MIQFNIHAQKQGSGLLKRLQTTPLISLIRPQVESERADVYVMRNSIDCVEKAATRPIQGSSSVSCSIQVLINNIKGETWLKVDEMKSFYNAKPRGLFAGSQGDRILQSVQLKKNK